MSVVSPQDRLAGTRSLSTVHSAVAFQVRYVVVSLDAKDVNLAAHLMSAEFVDADNHAEITFTSGELAALEFIQAA